MSHGLITGVVPMSFWRMRAPACSYRTSGVVMVDYRSKQTNRVSQPLLRPPPFSAAAMRESAKVLPA